MLLYSLPARSAVCEGAMANQPISFDSWDIAGLVFLGSILVFAIVWRLLAAWARWYLRRRESDFRKVAHVERRCERAGSQAEFGRRLRPMARDR